MVVNHDRLKHCRDRDIPLWLSRYQEKFRSVPAETVTQPSEGEVPLDSPMQSTGASSSPPIGSPNPSQSQGVDETPGPSIARRRRRGRPRKNKDPTPDSSAKSSDPNLSDGDTYCICHKPDDGRLMVQCDQCEGWFHGVCVGVTSEEASSLDQYICPPCSGTINRLRSIFLSSDSETSPERGWRHERAPDDRRGARERERAPDDRLGARGRERAPADRLGARGRERAPADQRGAREDDWTPDTQRGAEGGGLGP